VKTKHPKMKKLFFLATLFILVETSFWGQTKRNIEETPVIYLDTLITIDSLNLVPYTENEYNKYFSEAKIIKNYSNPNFTKTDSSYIVKTKNSVFEISDTISYESSYYYKRYISSIPAHYITHCGEGYCSDFLIDYKTDERFYLDAPFDAGIKGMQLSKNNTYLVVYSTYDGPDYDDYYSTRSSFTLYKIEKNKGLKGMTVYYSFDSTEWSIEELIWINKNTLALKVYTGERNGDTIDGSYLYYTVQID
jgi:hypothetical protein